MSASEEAVILIADDDAGHVRLIEKNLRRASLTNRIIRFGDGQEVLDFLFRRSGQPAEQGVPYVLLLDIRMPKVDGVEVLRQLKEDENLRKIPVIMLTTTDDPQDVERCHFLGCSSYIVKPVDYGQYAGVVHVLAQFLSLNDIPERSVET